ncbi:MAG: glycogen phosphorylase [Bdellovibrionales bacterium RIFOXYD12_FULL_39_22]|nr:MAG: glycogen phosphorylase [Bdellovibrionales bacterium RIFOXYB1_FULL_39_21]OFZ44445.1 MAG: glycogen phosphorylase [Bdellovibrionales bacterium RIFOXYC12_FULL_39_17]OFZ49913.1 MAG: glycogen phosphorylase [Bdellovibrionales bacterium RIFOXYC1_FULL_39_130]OFZ71690.1 MAG: glycogen phosphorylase [Bdellovibrionales bacterium RIFOXYC2_FULL_39_8]OFZ76918.1 MAG: glycogen phosphorylase [Bdellovibrionales bacterium RIFOXYD1_FULL_39_84]OFZ95845.1 MAG: glycogen phosphorylase [Bdellovibrionales bacteri
MESTKKSLSRNGLDTQSILSGFEDHLRYQLARDRYSATEHDRFFALASTIRDRLVDKWINTQQSYHKHDVKRVYYLSLEYLMGRAMGNSVINLGIEKEVREALSILGLDWDKLRDEEVDAGLGNGGLGRLAACFVDSLATLQIPSIGYGIRYDFGIFNQKIDNGRQLESPDDWLRYGNPWEIQRPEYRIPVHFKGRVVSDNINGKLRYRWIDTMEVIGIPYDTPIVGYKCGTVNTLRLWSARATEEFDLDDFNSGNYVASVELKIKAETLTKVLYPSENVYEGKELRLKQQYFFIACSLFDILRRFKSGFDHGKIKWEIFPDRAAIQLNDTHPSLSVPELMRLFMDEEGLEWEDAWDLTTRSLGYTNHTLLPEALEKWPVEMMTRLLPRHMQIIYEINHRFLQAVALKFPGDNNKLKVMSIVSDDKDPQVRMANLSIVGSHSTNGVASIHTNLLKTLVVPEFFEMYPERFNSKTNGVTQRRWLLKSNPPLANLINESIGDGWIKDLSHLRKLEEFASDSSFQEKFREIKRQNKITLSRFVHENHGVTLNPDFMFDVQVKRIHEYKRQLLNLLHVVMLYNRLLENSKLSIVPRTFIFSGKAAPGYHNAKLIIKLINNVAKVVNAHPHVSKYLKIYFLPNYRVSLAERLFPASDLSEQISTAGKEASGTGNMKFMLNGALTIGTLDGANIEILEEVGPENIFIFGLKVDQIEASRGYYSGWWHYNNEPEIKRAIDLILSGHFNIGESGLFEGLRGILLDHDTYFHLADLTSYANAQAAVQEKYLRPKEWTTSAILNVARSGKFSSDRTIMEYAEEIWNIRPHPCCQQDQGKKD